MTFLAFVKGTDTSEGYWGLAKLSKSHGQGCICTTGFSKMLLPQVFKETKLPPGVKSSSRRKYLAKEQCRSTWSQFTAGRSHWWSSARIDTEIGDIQLSALR